MRNLILFLSLLVFGCSAFGQKRVKNFTTKQEKIVATGICECPETNKIYDATTNLFKYCNPVDSISFAKIYKRDFGFLVTNSENSSFLSKLVFTIDKPSFSFRYLHISDKKRPIFSYGFDAKGTISDNVSTLFNGTDGWSPSISLSPRVNIDLVKAANKAFGYGGQLYHFDTLDRNQHICRIRALDNELNLREAALRLKKNARQTSLDSMKIILSNTTSKVIQENVRNIIGKFQMDIDSVSMLIGKISSYNKDKKIELNNKFEWTSRRFIWLSLGYNFTSKSYNVFDVNNVKDQNISAKDIWIKSPSISLNFYQTSEKKTTSFKNLNFYVGLTYSNDLTNDILDDNYNKKFEKEIINYSQDLGNPSQTFKNTEKKSFYVGNDFIVTNHKVAFQGIFYFSEAKRYGLDLHLSYQKPDSKSTLNVDYYNGGLGIIIPTVGSDGKSKLNVIATLEFSDLWGNIEDWKLARNNTYVQNRLKDRLSFGLKVGLPIYKL